MKKENEKFIIETKITIIENENYLNIIVTKKGKQTEYSINTVTLIINQNKIFEIQRIKDLLKLITGIEL